MGIMRFAGHETFACRSTWLIKGAEAVRDSGWAYFTLPESVVRLGVGKNMVLSIRYWMQAFNVCDGTGEFGPSASLFIRRKGPAIDPLLESQDSLWLLHVELVNTGFASIYSFFFKEFFKRKSGRFFTESEFHRSLASALISSNQRIPSHQTLVKDFKVLLDLYCVRPMEKNEEAFMNLLTDLNLVVRTAQKVDGEPVYELNMDASATVSNAFLGALLMDVLDENSSVSFDRVYESVGTVLLFTREAFLLRLYKVCEDFPEYFVFKEDAGIRELQGKRLTTKMEFFHSSIMLS